MKAISKMEDHMEMVKKLGQTKAFTWVNTWMVKRMVLVKWFGNKKKLSNRRKTKLRKRMKNL